MSICSNRLDAPSIVSAEQLYQHFAGISNDPLAVPLDGFLAGLEGEVKMFPLLSLSQVTFPVIGVHWLNIFNTSIRTSIFPSAWEKSLVLALNKVSSPRTMGGGHAFYSIVGLLIKGTRVPNSPSNYRLH